MPALGTAGAVTGLLVFGTLTSLVAKIVYEFESVGSDGELKYFRKPWFMTATPFVGMVWCLPVALWQERSKCKVVPNGGDGDAAQALLGHSHSSEAKRTQHPIMLAIPAAFDIVATVLMNTGLLSVTASVYQMMRGAEMIFAALLAVTLLQRTLNRLHYGGLAACVGGIAIVGLASVLSGTGGSKEEVSQAQIVVGMLLIVLSQAVQACQITCEDYFLSNIGNVSPTKIVGYEGLWGTLMICVCLVIANFLPGEDGGGVHEDLWDTLCMLRNSGMVLGLFLLQVAGLLFYNIGGMTVTGHLGAVFRSILETVRTLFVWLVGLGLYYGGTGLGERIDAWSALQAAGFAALVAGTVVYGRGDDAAASEAVEEFIQQERAASIDAEAPAAPATPEPAPAQNVEDAPSEPQAAPQAPPSRSSAIAMPRASPGVYGNAPLSANSYQQAVATSLRRRGFISATGTSESNDL